MLALKLSLLEIILNINFKNIIKGGIALSKTKSTDLFISLSIIITLLFSSIVPYGNVFAEGSSEAPFYEIPKTAELISNDVSFSVSDNEPKELTEFRTAKSKRYLNPNGSFTEKIYTHPVNYKDKTTGKWLPIESNLVTESTETYKNKKNRFNISMHKNANGFVSYSEDGTTLSFRPSFANPVKGTVTDNVMEYVDVTTDTDMIYAITPNGLKETLILKSKDAPTVFTYEIKLKNLYYEMQEDGSVVFFKEDSNQPIFSFEKPFLVDANLQMSTNASYQFRKEGKNKIYLDLVADAEWLQASGRAFPVEFDPTITSQGSSVRDTFVSSLHVGTNYDLWSHMYVGNGDLGITRPLLEFDLTNIPSSSTISSANITVLNTQVWSAQTPVVEAHRITQDWDASTVTWTTKPEIGGVDGSITASNSTGPYSWNIPITDLVQDWYDGTQDNYGVALKYADENLTTREVLSTNDIYDQSNHPHLTINYTIDALGHQPFWTFDGPVNMANGNLVFGERDIALPGFGVDLTVDRTYNSRSTSSGVFGYGWNSPLDMSLTVAEQGSTKLIDGNGTAHYFKKNTDGSYISPPGLYLKLSEGENTGEYIITTTDKTEYKFLNNKLEEIKDVGGNTLTFSNTGSQITIKDKKQNTITLSYVNGRVETATDPANRIWQYNYDGNGNLIKVITPDSKIIEYRYDSDHNLIAVVSPNGDTSYFSYSSDDRVVAINPINAITNSNFEVDADGNGVPDHFYIWTGQTGQDSIDSNSDSPYDKAFKINTSSNTYNYTVFLSDPILVDPSKTYTLSGYLKGQQDSGTLTTVLSLIAYDNNDNNLGEFARSAPTGTLAWERYKNSSTLPAETVKVRVKIAASVSSGLGSSWWDGIQLEEGNEATEFVSGTQYTSHPPTSKSASYDGEGRKHLYTYNEFHNITKYQQDPLGLNLTDIYEWNEDANEFNKINTLKSHTDPNDNTWSFVNDPNTGYITEITDPNSQNQIYEWDSITNLLSKYTDVKSNEYDMTYDEKHNNLTIRDPYNTNISIVQNLDGYGRLEESTTPISLADNLIDNSSFEGNNTNGMPDHFSRQSGQEDTWSVVSDESKFGKNSFKLTASSSNPTNYTVVYSDPITVEAGSDYVLSGYLKVTQTSGTQNGVLSVYAYNGANEYLKEVGRINVQGDISKWQRWSTSINKSDLPTDTNTIRVKMAASNSIGTGESYFDAIQIQSNPIDTEYNLVDNSSFERGTNWPNNWEAPSGGVSKWETTKTYAGDSSVSISNASDWEGISTENYIPYDESKSYNLSVFIKTENLGADVAHIKLEYYDSNKTRIGQVASDFIGGDKGWNRIGVDIVENAGPDNTAYIRPVLVTGSASGTVYFDNVRLQEGNYTVEYEYVDSKDWVQSIKDPLDNLITYNYDASGNVKSVTDFLGNIISLEYWNNSNRIKSIEPTWIDSNLNDLKISYDYDENGSLKSIKNTNAQGNTDYNETKFEYNKLGQIASVTDPMNKKTSYSYSPAGKLEKVTDFDNSSVSYKYDKAHRLTDVYFDGTLVYQYDYDANGNLKTINDVVQYRTFDATYDNLNRLTSWDDKKGKIDYAIDTIGNVKQNILTVGALTKTLNIDYNNINQPITLTDADGKVSKFLFNEIGQLSTIQSGNGVNQRLDYDSVSRVTEVLNKTGTGQVLSSSKYEYTANDYVDIITDQDNQTLNYTYTANGQLETEKLPSENTVEYEYDPLGNIKKRVEKQSDGTEVSTTTFAYDTANQLIMYL